MCVTQQEKNKKLVGNEVMTCQSGLLDMLLKKEIFHYDDIENLFPELDEYKDYGYESKEDFENNMTPKDIFEWWVVSDWLIEKLKEENEPILVTDYGTWWGRTCTGQAILLDSVITKIQKKTKYADNC